VPLLEKAWAKLHGTYKRVVGGRPAHAARHLLGLPTIDIMHSKGFD
jgi:Calpain family cysteine protease